MEVSYLAISYYKSLEMSSIVKRVFTALFGLIYGGLSFYWNLLGIVFVIPDCTPDSKEWEEYTLCLPIGIMMLLSQ